MRDLHDGVYLQVYQFDRRQTRWALEDDMDVSVVEHAWMMERMGHSARPESDSEDEDNCGPEDQVEFDMMDLGDLEEDWGDFGDSAC
jgi:hypothetical protein